jgi:hypothetical protein
MSDEAAFAIWFMAIGATTLIVIGMWITYWVYKAKLLEREERRLMIERGMTPPPATPAGSGGWPGVKARELELKAAERRLLIEKGLAIPPDPPPAQADTLRRGLVFLALGLGLAGGYVVFKTSGLDASQTTENWFLFFGVISPGVALYGAANILHYRMTNVSKDSNA